MLKLREYKILKQLKIYQDKKSDNNNYQANDLDKALIKNIKYDRSTLNTILENLEEDDYIVDIFNKIPTNIHTIELTDKGKDAVNNYLFNVFLAILKYIIIAFVTLLIEHLFDIINSL